MMAISDWFEAGFGDAVADIRRKIVDEAWFGRPSEVGLAREPSFSELMGWALVQGAKREQAPPDQEQLHGLDIDR